MAAIAAVLVGLALGLLGSGGSILAVPLLVLLVGQPEKVAIAGSLAIVGSVAAVGAVLYAMKGQVDRGAILLFGLPGLVGTWAGAAISRYVPGAVQLTVFAAVMLVAAAAMLRRPRVEPARSPGAPRYLLAGGVGVGALTGFVGVGGGFLIVPSLVVLAGLPARIAVGTSLAIIALNSAVGFAGQVRALSTLGLQLDLPLLAGFAAIGCVGSLAGQWIGGRMPQRALRRLFALTLMLLAGLVIARVAYAGAGG